MFNWFFVLSIPLFIINCVNGAFDYQVAGRVTDKIQDFLYIVSEASNVPAFVLNSKIVNITDPFSAAPVIFYPSQKVYRQLVGDGNFYVGFDTGLFYCMSVDYNLLQTTAIINDTIWVIQYSINPVNGYVNNKTLALNAPYNVTGRPWYQDGKASNATQLWSKPFLGIGTDGVTISTSVNFLQPIRNATLYKKHYNFAGIVATQIDLGYITTYLEKTFRDSYIKVIIVDKSSLNLISNSFGADIGTPTDVGMDFVFALNSNDQTISAATRKLASLNWPQELVLLGDQYLQSTVYVDTIPGIEWYVIVLLPASLQADYLEPGSALYYAVIVMAVVSMLACIVAICTTLYYRKTRLMRLTKPVLTCIVLTGGILLSIHCLLLLGENTNMSCTIRLWLFNLAFTLSFAPLLVKSYLVHWLFNENSLRKKTVNMRTVVFATLGFVIIDGIIMTITIYTNPNASNAIKTTKLLNNGAYGEVTSCNANQILIYVEVFFKGCLILAGCVLSFLIRNIVDGISNSKIHLIVIYNVGFISGISLLILKSLSDVSLEIVTETAGICYCIVVTAGLMVVPTVYTLCTEGDDQATDNMMSELRRGQLSSSSSNHFGLKRGRSMSVVSGRSSVNGTTANGATPGVVTGRSAGGGSWRRFAKLEPFVEQLQEESAEDSKNDSKRDSKRDSKKDSKRDKDSKGQAKSIRDVIPFEELPDEEYSSSDMDSRSDFRQSSVEDIADSAVLHAEAAQGRSEQVIWGAGVIVAIDDKVVEEKER